MQQASHGGRRDQEGLQLMAKVEEIHEGGEWLFVCPGCKCGHSFNTVANRSNGVGGLMPVWTFNGDVDKPTFRASLLVRWNQNGVPQICHSFVTDGMIQFLNDCTHELAGQTVPLEDIE